MNKILTTLLLASLLVGCGGDDASQTENGDKDQNAKSDQQLRGTPEELAQSAFDAFVENDKEAYKRLTMANFSEQEWVVLLEEAKASGAKVPSDRSNEELAAEELKRSTEGFEETWSDLQSQLKEEGIDPGQAKFVKFDIKRPTAEELERMGDRGPPFDFADVTIVFTFSDHEYRLRVDDCMKLPGQDWTSNRAP